MDESLPSRESNEYAAVLSEVFSAFVRDSLAHSTADPSLGITPALAECLEFVYLHGVVSVGRIAEGLNVTEPAASQLVDRLVRLELAARGEDAHDRRLSRVSLTESGVEAAVRNRAARKAAFTRALDRIPSDKRRAFVESLEAFLTAAIGDEEDIEKFCNRCGIDHVAFCVLNRIHQAMTGAQFDRF